MFYLVRCVSLEYRLLRFCLNKIVKIVKIVFGYFVKIYKKLPFFFAISSGVKSFQPLILSSAPFSSNNSTNFAFPISEARNRGVEPSSFVRALIFACLLIRNFAISPFSIHSNVKKFIWKNVYKMKVH